MPIKAAIFSVAPVDQQFLASHLRTVLMLGSRTSQDCREIVEKLLGSVKNERRSMNSLPLVGDNFSENASVALHNRPMIIRR